MRPTPFSIQNAKRGMLRPMRATHSTYDNLMLRLLTERLKQLEMVLEELEEAVQVVIEVLLELLD